MAQLIAAPLEALQSLVATILPDTASGTAHDVGLIIAIVIVIWIVWRIIRRILRRVRARILGLVLPLIMLAVTQTPALAGSAQGIWNNPALEALVPAGFLGGWGAWVIAFFFMRRRRF